MKSKDMFLEMRAAEVANMYDSSFTKKEAIKKGVETIINFLDQGEADPIKVWGNICRLKEVVNSMDATFRDKITLTEKQTINGITFNPVEGGYNLNYADDPIYNVLKQDLDNRVELLKLAQKQDVIDGYGNNVPKVSKTPRKSTITVTF